MAFNIAWKLDESEGISADSLLGRISLTDGTRSMVQDSVYLDSWMKALVEASQAAEEGSLPVDIDIVEESRPLRILRDLTGGLHVGFGGTEVVADSVQAFANAVQTAAGDFMNRTASIENGGRNKTLEQIRRLGVPGGRAQ